LLLYITIFSYSSLYIINYHLLKKIRWRKWYLFMLREKKIVLFFCKHKKPFTVKITSSHPSMLNMTEVCQEFSRGPFSLIAYNNYFATRSLPRLRHEMMRVKSADCYMNYMNFFCVDLESMMMMKPRSIGEQIEK